MVSKSVDFVSCLDYHSYEQCKKITMYLHNVMECCQTCVCTLMPNNAKEKEQFSNR
jgi:hypothetical protein